MAIELYDSSNDDGLFDILGQLLFILEKADEWKDGAATLKSHVATYITGHHKKTWTTKDLGLVDPIVIAYERERDDTSLASVIQSTAIGILHAFVEEDADQPEQTILNSIEYLIDEMTTQSHYVDANVAGASRATGGSNVGDTGFMYSIKDAKGFNLQHALAEAISMKVTGVSDGIADILVESTIEATKLAHTWPDGSGLLETLSTSAPEDHSHLPNGTFVTQTYTNIPDNWIVGVGTVGTTVKITAPEEQTVVVAGTPTAGTYTLSWQHPNGKTYTTNHLTYNSGSSAVQTELRSIPGLDIIEVAQTGSDPNYTHTVTFKGSVGGNVNQLTSTLFGMGGGSLTHATTTAGSAGGFRGGYSLEFDSNGSELTAMYAPIADLERDTCYFLSARMKREGAAAAGNIYFSIVDSVGGSTITDTAGNTLEISDDASSISTSSFQHQWMRFSIKPSQSMPVYLKISINSAITNTASIFFDDITVMPGTQLYSGGPYVALLRGKTDPAVDDNWTLTTTNNRAGEIQTMFDRIYDMGALGKYLPTSGSTLIPDSVIS